MLVKEEYKCIVKLPYCLFIGICFSILLDFQISYGYKILPNKLAFPEAQEYCKRTGSSLASIHTYSDLVKVQALCNGHDSNEKCWVGGIHDNDALNCIYSWIDGSEWIYDPPRYNQTEECQFDQECSCVTTPQTSIYEENTLHDCLCNDVLRPICNDG